MSHMPPWRETTRQMFPELDLAINKVADPYDLWFELRIAYKNTYTQTPKNESLIRRIYQFGHWCEIQPRGQTAEDDLFTAVCVCFYEHIPDMEPAWQDMPRWFSLHEVDNMRELWEYRFKNDGYLQLRKNFMQRKKAYQPKLRNFDPKKWPASSNPAASE